jgi:type I restriction enzyme R subunit
MLATYRLITIANEAGQCNRVRAQLRVLVKRILRKHGYPPDKQARATQTVLEQAALLSEEWATA